MEKGRNILISRVDSIGDVVLTLPMAGVLKYAFPDDNVLFLGRNYTKDVVALSKYVDTFINYDDLLNESKEERIKIIKSYNIDICIHVFPIKAVARLIKKAGVKTRIGTTNRLFHLSTCNKLVRLSRKNSNLHESQLNLKLLAPLGIIKDFTLKEIVNYYGFKNVLPLDEKFRSLLNNDKKKIIVHPKSKGSAKEWGLTNFGNLIELLIDNNYQVFISGTKEEGDSIREFIDQHPRATDLTGKLTLQQFISFINECDGLVAASTGPLHIASALKKKAIGLYSARRPIHPGRWKPVGKRAEYLVNDEECEKCAQKKECDCIKDIGIERVLDKI